MTRKLILWIIAGTLAIACWNIQSPSMNRFLYIICWVSLLIEIVIGGKE